jgi:cytochrome c
MKISLFLAIASCLGSTVHVACAEGDVAMGEKVFKKCLPCHNTNLAPHLRGVFNRPVATVEGFAYSEAMKEFGATGAIWDEATLDSFLKDPMALVRWNKMAFPPLNNNTERADVIAFLKSKSP